MSKRSMSPIRTGGVDPREEIIRKLKEELIKARSHEKESRLLEQYLCEQVEKSRALEADLLRSEEEWKGRFEGGLRSIAEARKELEMLRTELKASTDDMKHYEIEFRRLQKELDDKNAHIGRLQGEGVHLQADDDKMADECYRLRVQEEEIEVDIRRADEVGHEDSLALAEIKRKIAEVTVAIEEIAEENGALREQLESFGNQNEGIDDDIELKNQEIDLLERQFEEQHSAIKELIERIIEATSASDKLLKEIRQNSTLLKQEGEKKLELEGQTRKLEGRLNDLRRQLEESRERCRELVEAGKEQAHHRDRLSHDLQNCQHHLEAVLRENKHMQEETETFLLQDSIAMNILRKKALPGLEHLRSVRTSRVDRPRS